MAAARTLLVGAILMKDGKLLLGRRSVHKKSYPGVWDIFGGHVEPGEQGYDALVRELEEELGVTPVRAWQIKGDIEVGETHALSIFLAMPGTASRRSPMTSIPSWAGLHLSRQAR